MDYYFDPVAGVNVPGKNPLSNSMSGLDPSNISYGMTGGSPGKAPSWMDSGYAPTPGTPTATYSGSGGTWTSKGGSWTGGTGQQVNNLAGYLGMQKNLQSGADFSGYQSKLNDLLTDPTKIQQTPGYQFALDQGNQAINRSAAAKGMLNSGGVLAELAKYGQGMASQNYGNQVNTLADLMRGSQQFGVQSGYYQPAPPAIKQQFASTAQPSWW